MFLLVYNLIFAMRSALLCEIDRKIVIFFEFIAMNNYVLQHISQKINRRKPTVKHQDC